MSIIWPRCKFPNKVPVIVEKYRLGFKNIRMCGFRTNKGPNYSRISLQFFKKISKYTLLLIFSPLEAVKNAKFFSYTFLIQIIV